MDDRIGWSKVFFFFFSFFFSSGRIGFGLWKEGRNEGRKEGWVVYDKVQVPGGCFRISQVLLWVGLDYGNCSLLVS